MKTIGDVSMRFQQELANVYEPREIDAIALLVMTEILQTSRSMIKAFPEQLLIDEQTDHLASVLSQLKMGKPVQYILGYTEFYGLPFKVNSSVLIPRPETEELVEWALTEGERLKVKGESESLLQKGERQKVKGESEDLAEEHIAKSKFQNPDFSILDIGTGSGCIAISLKKNLPDANVTAIDISEGALETARNNAQLNNVNINFIQANILMSIHDFHPSLLATNYSLIISNPPYVTLEDKTKMHVNVTDFEPQNALFVPEEDPLIFYRAIAGFARQNLEENGLLFFEINEAYGNGTVELLQNKGFKNIELRKDMSGRDRMIKAVK